MLAADKIRVHLSAGCPAEDIGIVVRNLDTWAEPLRTGLHDYGIPFSGIAVNGMRGASQRQVLAIVDSFREGERAEIGRWLSAAGLAANHEIALAMDVRGVRWVNEVSDRMPSGSIPLPVREGFGLVDEALTNVRVRLSSSLASQVRTRALAWVTAWQQWPQSGLGSAHVKHAESILHDVLKAPKTNPAWAALQHLQRAIPAEASMSRSGFVRMFNQTLEQQAVAPLGGHGGGVVVLDAVEARGRTFEHLYVLGLNRGQFPRVVREDPLLPEPARRALGQLIPDIREKRLGIDEERFLFAQLLQAGRHVRLSMSERDGSGKSIHPSSLVVGLELHERCENIENGSLQTVPPWRAGVLAALSDRSASAKVLGIPVDLHQICMARAGYRGAHNPYMGSIGPASHPMDSRNRSIYVTAVEAVARCPWQAFLVRELGLEARPDPWGPLPAVGNFLLGRVVHMVIERVVAANRESAEEGIPVSVQWPSDSTLESWTVEAAAACLLRDGVAWQGFAKAVVGPARASIEILKRLDVEMQGILGGEVEGAWTVPDGPTIHFRADRVARRNNQTVLTDFKLGRPPTVHKKPETRRSKVLEAIRKGTLLQGMVYACSSGADAGEYMYLGVNHEPPQRIFEFAANDMEVQDALAMVIEEVMAVRQQGAMFPRVSESETDKIPTSCDHCAVREACPVIDSGHRRQVIEAAKSSSGGALADARSALWWRGGGTAT
jgi:hypothetical protein